MFQCEFVGCFFVLIVLSVLSHEYKQCVLKQVATLKPVTVFLEELTPLPLYNDLIFCDNFYTPDISFVKSKYCLFSFLFDSCSHDMFFTPLYF